MNIAFIFAITFVALFALVFFTRRRFGLLGFALAVGSILSELWSKDVTPLVQSAGVELVAPPLVTVVAAAILLLPALILIIKAPAHKHLLQRLVSAAAFAALAIALLLPVFGDALVLEGEGMAIYETLVNYRPWIVTGGLVYALVDIFMARGGRSSHSNKEH